MKIEEWLRLVEQKIAERTTPPRTRGKYKGHGSTNSLAWVLDMASAVNADIRRRNRGIGYDENMAIAEQLGTVLLAWYFNVHRAKSQDANRPLSIRRKVDRLRRKRLAALVETLTSDELMAKVWSDQAFNPPFGKQAKGGKFV